jgi:DNA-binding PadR family transcriptional regulator
LTLRVLRAGPLRYGGFGIVLCMKVSKVEPESFLPLSAGAFDVLVALADGEKHGYAILKDVRRRAGGKAHITTGALYAVIKRLSDDALVEESEERPDPALDDERRRYYRLTPLGRRVAQAEVRRMEGALTLARARKLFGRPLRSRG